MAVTTVTYSPGIQGFPSRYSFEPDYMVTMNNKFYSFKEGNLFQHHSDNVDRLEFYGDQYDAEITFVFNDRPLERKVFKTISLEGNDAWTATMTADSGQTGTITDTFFEEKEVEFFAFVRFNTGSTNFRTRNTGGIGVANTVTGTVGNTVTITFTGDVNTILNIGDDIYFSNGSSETKIGPLTTKSTNQITIDSSLAVPSVGNTIFYVKNSQAESYGLLGSFIEVRLNNNSTTQVELFAAQSEVMKSFP
jgi:hypothetical protein